MSLWIKNPIIKEDLENIIYSSNIDWSLLKNSTVLITGATGEIGRFLINALLYANKNMNLKIQVLALVRDIKKANVLFEEQLKYDNSLSFIEGNVEAVSILNGKIDYVIHGASPTKGSYFIEYPVETIWTNVEGTRRLLEIAKQKKVQGFVYLSSMEIYGGTDNDIELSESFGTTIDTMYVRNSYPESKRLGEILCASYYKEYGVSAKVIRLAQTFGAGMSEQETRVFAQFANAVLKEEDIVLHTKGTSCRGYLYMADAVTAIISILLHGEAGEAYNAVNEDTYCSIYEMATLVADKIAKGTIRVVIAEDVEKKKEYPKSGNLRLSSRKLKKLGWKPTVDLEDMYTRMINGMIESRGIYE